MTFKVGQSAITFGDVPIHRAGGKWRATFEHRGSSMVLECSSLRALRGMLLQLKKVEVPMDADRYSSGWHYLRLYEIYTTRPDRGPFPRDRDDKLLLEGLIQYAPSIPSIADCYPKDKPELMPASLTEKGKALCRNLFFESRNNRTYQENEDFHEHMKSEMEDILFRRAGGPEFPPEPFVAIRRGSQVCGLYKCDMEAVLSLVCEKDGEVYRIKPWMLAPPGPGHRVNSYWVEFCAERIWTFERGYIDGEM